MFYMTNINLTKPMNVTEDMISDYLILFKQDEGSILSIEG